MNAETRPRQAGKSEAAVRAARAAAAQGKRVLIVTADQGRTVEAINRHAPGALCEPIGDDFVRPHWRRP